MHKKSRLVTYHGDAVNRSKKFGRHFTCVPLISPKHCTIAVITTPTATAGYMGPTGTPSDPGTVEPSTVLTNTKVAMNSASMARHNCRLRSSLGRQKEGEGPVSSWTCTSIVLIEHREGFHKGSEKADDTLWSTLSSLTNSSKDMEISTKTMQQLYLIIYSHSINQPRIRRCLTQRNIRD